MSVMALLGSVGPVAKLLLKGLELIDPKTRDWVHKRRALEYAEKYIRCNEELRRLEEKLGNVGLSRKEARRLGNRRKYLRYFGNWFFKYD